MANDSSSGARPRSTDNASRRFHQACADMDRQLRAGQSFPTEEWVADTGPLSGEADLAVELIFTEYVTRESLGQTPNPEDYYRRFPPFAERLRRLFGVDELLKEASTDATPAEPGAPRLPDQIGRYIPREVLGVGGAGVVYKAYDPTLRRDVAVKVLRSGAEAAPAEHARFRKEAGAVARLNHPNVVQVFEADEQDGRPFLVMEYVPGGTLRAMIAERRLAPMEAAELVETLARAVGHAHERGVIHRDLKPANVLMADGSDATPQAAKTRIPKITDFGLAAHFSPDAAHTATGQLIGTASYMAPEQAEAKPGWVTHAVDVYALGAILYELLVGRPPFLADNPLDVLRLVIAAEPVAPRQAQPTVPRDLETVCLACLRKDPKKRYASAEELAEDLRRVRAKEPIAARPVGFAERAWKAVRRRPALFAAGGVALLAVAALFVGELMFAAQLKAERDAKEGQRREAEAGRLAAEKEEAEANAQRERAEKEKAKADAQRDRAEELARRMTGLRYATQLLRASLVCDADPAAAAAFLRDEEFCPEDARETAWHLIDARTRPTRHIFAGHAKPATGLAANDDGTLVVTAALDGSVCGWNAVAAAERFHLPTAHDGPVTSVALSADGAVMVTASADTVTIWAIVGDVPTPKVELANLGAKVAAVAVSRDGARVAAAVGPDVIVWNADGTLRVRLAAKVASPVRSVAFSPDGVSVAVGHQTTKSAAACRVWEWEKQQLRYTFGGHAATVAGIAYSQNGRILVTTTCGAGPVLDAIRVWDARTFKLINTLPSPLGVWAVAPSADGSTVAAAGADGTLAVWDALFGKRRAAFRITHTAHLPKAILSWESGPSKRPECTAADMECSISGIAFVGDGPDIITADAKGGVRVSAPQPDRDRRAVSPKDIAAGTLAATDAAGSHYLTTSVGTVSRVAPDGTRTSLFNLPAFASLVTVTPDGRRLAISTFRGPAHKSPGGDFEVWDATGKQLFKKSGPDMYFSSAVFAADGETVLTGGWDGRARLWSATTGEVLATAEFPVWEKKPPTVKALAYRADGEGVFASGRSVFTCPMRDAKPVPVERATFEREVATLAVADGGRRVCGSLAGRPDKPHEYFTLDLASPNSRTLFAAQTGFPSATAISADGRTVAVAVAGADRKVRVFQPSTGQELLVLDAGNVRPSRMYFAADRPALVLLGWIDRLPVAVRWGAPAP